MDEAVKTNDDLKLILYDDPEVKLSILTYILSFNGLINNLEMRATNLQLHRIMHKRKQSVFSLYSPWSLILCEKCCIVYICNMYATKPGFVGYTQRRILPRSNHSFHTQDTQRTLLRPRSYWVYSHDPCSPTSDRRRWTWTEIRNRRSHRTEMSWRRTYRRTMCLMM